MIKWKEKQYHCPVEVSMDLLSGKMEVPDALAFE
jgi:hypothetical protein